MDSVTNHDQSLCFTCGKEVGSPPQLNRLENGLPCPSCRDRILAYLPPALPGPGFERRPEPELRDEVSLAPVHERFEVVEGEDPDQPA